MTATERAGVAAWGYLALAVALLGLNWPMMKLGLGLVGPVWMTALRFTGTAIPAALLCLASAQGLRWPARQDWPVVLSVGLVQMLAVVGLISLALRFVPASRATVLIYTTPLWVTLIELLAFGSAVSLRALASLAISAAGLAVILFGDHGAAASGSGLIGYGLLILASVLWAGCLVHVARHRWQGRPLDLVPWQMVIAALPTLVAAGLIEGPPPATLASPYALAVMGFIGPVATGIGFWALTEAGRRLPAALVAASSAITPVVGLTAAVLMLGEPFTPGLAMGGSLVVAGVALRVLARQSPPARQE